MYRSIIWSAVAKNSYTAKARLQWLPGHYGSVATERQPCFRS